MASKSSNKLRKRVEVDSTPASSSSLKRAKDGSAFSKCEECNKDVPVALISFHNCSLDAKIKMNLDTLDIVKPEVKKKQSSAEKKTKKPSEPKPRKVAAKKDGKKRPPTAFFVFMNDFRKTFKEENPECKSVATVAKEGGVRWKALSDEERKVYTDKAAELRAEYENEKEVVEVKTEAEDEKEVEEIEKKVEEIEDAETEDEKEVKEGKEDTMDEEEEVKEEEKEYATEEDDE